MRPWLVIFASSCALVGAAAARADEAAVYRAEEILVEGQAEAAPVEVYEDTPVQREVLDERAIEARPGTTTADLLRALPGVRQQQRLQGEEAAVSIEGMPPQFTRALVDGYSYAGEIGAVDDFGDLPLAGAERVEVLRGAQALRYGSDAAGGVVRIDTEDPPRDGLRSRLEGGYGTADWIYGAGIFGLGGERVGGWLRFVNDQIHGFEAPDDADGVLISAGEQSQRVSRDLYGKLRFAPRPDVELVTRLGWRRDDESGLAGEVGEGNREEMRWLTGQRLVWDLGEATRVETSWRWYDNELVSDVGRRFQLEEDEIGGRFALQHLLATGPVLHDLTFGFDAFRPHLDLVEEGGDLDLDDPRLGAGEVDESHAFGGIFAIAHSELTSWLAFEGGVRAQFHTDYAPRLLPQVALLVTPWRGAEDRVLRLRASWGLGYRTPSLRDLYQPPVPQLGGAYFLAGNPDLDPEHVESLRLGFEWAPDPRIGLAVTAFRNDIEDHIRSVAAGSIRTGTRLVEPDLTPEQEARCARFGHALPECRPVEAPIQAPLFRRENLDTVVTRGVETRLRLRPHARVQLELAWTYLDTEVEATGVDLEELPNEPAHVVDAQLGLVVPRLETRITALARWRDEALTETSGTGLASFGSLALSDPSWIVDLRVAQPVGDRFEVYADVLNATDERIVDSYVVRGRTFFLGVRGRFDGW